MGILDDTSTDSTNQDSGNMAPEMAPQGPGADPNISQTGGNITPEDGMVGGQTQPAPAPQLIKTKGGGQQVAVPSTAMVRQSIADLQQNNPASGQAGHMNSFGTGFYGYRQAQRMQADPAYAKNYMELQQAQGERRAAQQGGLSGTLDYLDRTNPKSATDLRKSVQDYNNSVLDGASKQTDNADKALKLQQDNMVFNANVYNKMEEIRATKGDQVALQFYKQFLPVLRQHDPGAPDIFDPQRAEIAKSQAITIQDAFKQDADRQTAFRNAAIEASKPQSDLAKQQLDLKNATSRGDFQAAAQLQKQVNNTLDNQSLERIKASNGDAMTLMKEHASRSQAYIVSRGAYGQAQAGFAMKTAPGDMAGIQGTMKLINPQLDLKPGEVATAVNAPGVPQQLIDSYNNLLSTGGKTPLNDQQRKQMVDMGTSVFQQKDTEQQQLDSNFSKAAQAYNIDPQKVVMDNSPKASPYTPQQEDELRHADPKDLDAALKSAAAATDPKTGRPLMSPQEIQQRKAMIDNIIGQHSSANTSLTTQPKLEQDLNRLAPGANPEVVHGLASNADVLSKFGINTPARAQQFAAQIAHETAGMKTTTEYSNGKAYEGKLGNTAPGDGALYKGRGPMQLTGKANYEHYNKVLNDNGFNVNIVANPGLVATDPRIGMATAAAYWQDHGLNKLADAGDIKGITKSINGGYNGLASRQKYLARAQNLGLFRGGLSEGDATPPDAQQGDVKKK